MSREITLEVPMDLPTTPRALTQFRMWLEAATSGVETFGNDGRPAGVGFVWETRTGFDNRKLHVFTRKIKRALRHVHLISIHCDPYNLEQRITYIRNGDGHGILMLRED